MFLNLGICEEDEDCLEMVGGDGRKVDFEVVVRIDEKDEVDTQMVKRQKYPLKNPK